MIDILDVAIAAAATVMADTPANDQDAATAAPAPDDSDRMVKTPWGLVDPTTVYQRLDFGALD
jgi:hypothetical protein